MSVRIIKGDVREKLVELPDDYFDCIVTSPPYYALRDYGTATWEGGDAACDHVVGAIRTGLGLKALGERYAGGGHKQSEPKPLTAKDECPHCGARRIDAQIGLEPTIDAYLETMVAVCRELRRVLKPSGIFFCNIGDSYAGSWGAQSREHAGKHAPNISALHANQVKAAQRRTHTGTIRDVGFKPKDLMLVPERLGIALQADGWFVRSKIIWSKKNPMPESCTDRPTSAHETIWMLTKSPRYFWDAEAVKEESLDFERGRAPRSYKDSTSVTMDGTTRIPGYKTPNVLPTRNLRNVWSFASQPFPGAHFATFPEELAERCIKAGSSEKGCCAACGAPWVRVIEHDLSDVPTRMASRTKRMPFDPVAISGYLRESRERLGLSRKAVDAALGTCTLYSWFEGRPAGIEIPTYEKWSKLKEILQLDDRFDDEISRTIEIETEVTDHSPSKAFGVRTYKKAWNSSTKTLGWQASCKCPPSDPIPARILDPFGGAGTTGLVADRLGRDCTLIDLNTEYAEMALKRIKDDCPMFTEVAAE